jgi:hypothetical protein
VPLKAIEEMLEALHEETGTSMTKFKKWIKNRGICLRNCKEYGSQTALRLVLLHNEKLIVPKEQAKAYKHVKVCLITVAGQR